MFHHQPCTPYTPPIFFSTDLHDSQICHSSQYKTGIPEKNGTITSLLSSPVACKVIRVTKHNKDLATPELVLLGSKWLATLVEFEQQSGASFHEVSHQFV